MVDLTPLDRLTRKRNSLLQKQLDVRLQIIQEEYRMTKKGLEKHQQDIGDFLMGLQHTAPGLSTYGQPDTRAMNAKNLMLERRFHNEQNNAENITNKGKDTQYKKDSASSKSKSESDSEKENSTKPPTGAVNSRNEFFNRRIVLDSRRRSFLQHNLARGGGTPTGISSLSRSRTKEEGTKGAELRRDGAVSHQGFLSSRDTAGESSRTPSRASGHGKRVQSARYGRDAYSNDEEFLHTHVMGRFQVIFDPQNEKPKGKINRTTPAATPIMVISPEDLIDSQNIPPTVFQTQATSNKMSAPPTSHVINHRVAWSAPPKRQESPITAVASTNKGAYQEARSPRAVPPPRPHSIQVMASNRGGGSGGGRGDVRAQSARPMRRPKTAPVNNMDKYDLMQRTMSAPRQQVAGILAEIQSRRADTRAMLSKSRQLRQMVKLLAPEPQKSLDDSFSD